MSERSSDSQFPSLIGVVFAVVAVVGYGVFGWRFGESGGILLALAVGGLLVSAGLELYWGLS